MNKIYEGNSYNLSHDFSNNQNIAEENNIIIKKNNDNILSKLLIKEKNYLIINELYQLIKNNHVSIMKNFGKIYELYKINSDDIESDSLVIINRIVKSINIFSPIFNK